MQGDEQVLERLNEVVAGELTAINQYFLDAKMFDDWGYVHLGERVWSESIGEMTLALEWEGGVGQIGEAHYLAQQIRG